MAGSSKEQKIVDVILNVQDKGSAVVEAFRGILQNTASTTSRLNTGLKKLSENLDALKEASKGSSTSINNLGNAAAAQTESVTRFTKAVGNLANAYIKLKDASSGVKLAPLTTKVAKDSGDAVSGRFTDTVKNSSTGVSGLSKAIDALLGKVGNLNSAMAGTQGSMDKFRTNVEHGVLSARYLSSAIATLTGNYRELKAASSFKLTPLTSRSTNKQDPQQGVSDRFATSVSSSSTAASGLAKSLQNVSDRMDGLNAKVPLTAEAFVKLEGTLLKVAGLSSVAARELNVVSQAAASASRNLAQTATAAGRIAAAQTAMTGVSKALSQVSAAANPAQVQRMGTALHQVSTATPQVNAATSGLKALNEQSAFVSRGLEFLSKKFLGVGKDSTTALGTSLKAFHELEVKLSQFNSGSITMAIGLASLGTALFVPFTMMIKASADLEQEMSKVKAVTGATTAEMAQMQALILKLGEDTPFTAKDAAEGLRRLSMAGFSVQEAMKALPTVLDMAAAGFMSIEKAADIATGIMHGYGMEASELAHATDVLVKAANSSNSSLEELGVAFHYAGSIAKTAGVEFNSTVGALALLHNAGMKGSMAGTALRGMMESMLNPTKQQADLMTDLSSRLGGLGLSLFDAAGNFRNFSEVILQFENAGVTTSEIFELFGQRAGPGFAALLQQGSASVAKFEKSLVGVSGATKEMADIMRDNLKGSFENLTSAVNSLAVNVGSNFLPLFSGIVQATTQVVKSMSDFADSFPAVTAALAGVLGAVGAVAAAVGGLMFAWFMLGIGAEKGAIVMTELGGTAAQVAAAILTHARASETATLSIRAMAEAQAKAIIEASRVVVATREQIAATEQLLTATQFTTESLYGLSTAEAKAASSAQRTAQEHIKAATAANIRAEAEKKAMAAFLARGELSLVPRQTTPFADAMAKGNFSLDNTAAIQAQMAAQEAMRQRILASNIAIKAQLEAARNAPSVFTRFGATLSTVGSAVGGFLGKITGITAALTAYSASATAAGTATTALGKAAVVAGVGFSILTKALGVIALIVVAVELASMAWEKWGWTTDAQTKRLQKEKEELEKLGAVMKDRAKNADDLSKSLKNINPGKDGNSAQYLAELEKLTKIFPQLNTSFVVDDGGTIRLVASDMKELEEATKEAKAQARSIEYKQVSIDLEIASKNAVDLAVQLKKVQFAQAEFDKYRIQNKGQIDPSLLNNLKKEEKALGEKRAVVDAAKAALTNLIKEEISAGVAADQFIAKLQALGNTPQQVADAAAEFSKMEKAMGVSDFSSKLATQATVAASSIRSQIDAVKKANEAITKEQEKLASEASTIYRGIASAWKTNLDDMKQANDAAYDVIDAKAKNSAGKLVQAEIDKANIGESTTTKWLANVTKYYDGEITKAKQAGASTSQLEKDKLEHQKSALSTRAAAAANTINKLIELEKKYRDAARNALEDIIDVQRSMGDIRAGLMGHEITDAEKAGREKADIFRKNAEFEKAVLTGNVEEQKRLYGEISSHFKNLQSAFKETGDTSIFDANSQEGQRLLAITTSLETKMVTLGRSTAQTSLAAADMAAAYNKSAQGGLEKTQTQLAEIYKKQSDINAGGLMSGIKEDSDKLTGLYGQMSNLGEKKKELSAMQVGLQGQAEVVSELDKINGAMGGLKQLSQSLDLAIKLDGDPAKKGSMEVTKTLENLKKGATTLQATLDEVGLHTDLSKISDPANFQGARTQVDDLIKRLTSFKSEASLEMAVKVKEGALDQDFKPQFDKIVKELGNQGVEIKVEFNQNTMDTAVNGMRNVLDKAKNDVTGTFGAEFGASITAGLKAAFAGTEVLGANSATALLEKYKATIGESNVAAAISSKFEKDLQTAVTANEKWGGSAGFAFNTKYMAALDSTKEAAAAKFKELNEVLASPPNMGQTKTVLDTITTGATGAKDAIIAAANVQGSPKIDDSSIKSATQSAKELLQAINAAIGAQGALRSSQASGTATNGVRGNTGGFVQYRNKGGSIFGALSNFAPMTRGFGGGDSSKDTVPAMLTPGEFVVREPMVAKYGLEFFQMLNSGMLKFANAGGYIKNKISPVIRGYNSGGSILSAGNTNSKSRDSIDLNFNFGGKQYPLAGDRNVVQDLVSALQMSKTGLSR